MAFEEIKSIVGFAADITTIFGFLGLGIGAGYVSYNKKNIVVINEISYLGGEMLDVYDNLLFKKITVSEEISDLNIASKGD